MKVEFAKLIGLLRRPAPKNGFEEFDPTFDVRQEAADALAGEVVVRPLEWRNDPRQPYLIADTILGQYAAWYIEPNGVWRAPHKTAGVLCGSSLDAAKAAAQADYEQRVRSALIVIPTSGDAVDIKLRYIFTSATHVYVGKNESDPIYMHHLKVDEIEAIRTALSRVNQGDRM